MTIETRVKMTMAEYEEVTDAVNVLKAFYNNVLANLSDDEYDLNFNDDVITTIRDIENYIDDHADIDNDS